jgi:hypothetical protein
MHVSCILQHAHKGVCNGGRRRRAISTWKTESGGRHAASDEQIAGRFHTPRASVRWTCGTRWKRRIKYFALLSLSSGSLGISPVSLGIAARAIISPAAGETNQRGQHAVLSLALLSHGTATCRHRSHAAQCSSSAFGWRITKRSLHSLSYFSSPPSDTARS